MDYKEQYLHPKWQKKRLEIMNRDEFKCSCCQSDDKTLHVHHNYYLPERMVWDYPNSCFSTLCEKCHKFVHKYKRAMSYEMTGDRIMRISNLIAINHTEYSNDVCLLFFYIMNEILFQSEEQSEAMDIFESLLCEKISADEMRSTIVEKLKGNTDEVV